jgi:hypothetical protein
VLFRFIQPIRLVDDLLNVFLLEDRFGREVQRRTSVQLGYEERLVSHSGHS